MQSAVLLIELAFARLHDQGPACGHCVARVDGEIEQHLLHLTMIGDDRGQVVRGTHHQLDVLADGAS